MTRKNNNIDISTRTLNSPFDIQKHKKVFINYLEIVIDPKGVCHYAVPSHRGKLEKVLLEQRGIECDEWNYSMQAGELCPRNKWCDYNEWLCEETGYIMVWGIPNSVVLGTANENQKEMLNILRKEGLY